MSSHVSFKEADQMEVLDSPNDLDLREKNNCCSCRNRHSRFLHSTRDNFREYCSNSSLHGFQYLGEIHRPIGERLCWLFSLILSLTACIFLILKVWNKWDTSPVIVSFSETSTPVWDIPFPAVTICSELKVRKDKFNFRKVSQSYDTTDEEDKKLQDLAQICNGPRSISSEDNKTTDESTVDFIMEVAQPCHHMMTFCQWELRADDECDDINPVLTEDGLCCTFNMLSPEDMYTKEVYRTKSQLSESAYWPRQRNWNLEGGYSAKTNEENVFPLRAGGAGAKAGLSILIEINTSKMDTYCRTPSQGFKLTLHNPVELPRVAQEFIRIPTNEEMVIGLNPSIITTSPTVRDYKPERRSCYFSSERKLRYFQTYTEQNCQTECFANITVKYCGCAMFYMPRNNSVPLCGTTSLECVQQASTMATYERTLDDKDSTDEVLHLGCECLPACTEIRYDTETSHSSFYLQDLADYGSRNVSDLLVARISIFYKNVQFITKHRSELYGTSDFLANCGGLLGLCLGFSVLSLVEIVYFMTIRLFSNLLSQRSRRQSEKDTYQH